MLKIILMDNDTFTCAMLAEIIGNLIREKGWDASIVCQASSTKEVVTFLEKNPEDYLFFLDVDMGNNELNGLDFSYYIRKKYPEAKIVFVTSHVEKSMDILKSGVEPFGFIEKQFNMKLMKRDFRGCIAKLCSHDDYDLEEKGPVISIPIGIDEEIKIPVERIAYVEAIKNLAHNICYHTVDGSQITVRDTLSHAKEMLGEDFVLSHRSVLVNQKQVIGVEKDQLRLSNGMLVACAVGKRSQFYKKRKD